MKSMNILFLSHRFYPFTGGIEINSEILATEFTRMGHQVWLLTWTKEEGEKKFEFEIIRNPSLKKLWEAHLWAEVVFENNPCYRLSWPVHFTKRKNVVAIRTLINRSNGKLGFQDKLKYRHIKRADKVIAVSSAIREACWPDAEVISNPYRHEIFKFIPNYEQRKDFVFLGRLVSQKRCELNIQLMAKLKESHPDRANLTIIGSGPELNTLTSLTKQQGLENNIQFLGELKGECLVQELNKYKFILIPSDFEAFGNVALEGIACGNLPIVSNNGGLVDAVGDAGLSFQSSDLESFYQTTVRVLEDSELEMSLRNNAEAHLNFHQPHKVAQRYLKVLEMAAKST